MNKRRETDASDPADEAVAQVPNHTPTPRFDPRPSVPDSSRAKLGPARGFAIGLLIAAALWIAIAYLLLG